MARHIVFMGWTTELPNRDKQSEQLDEHDILLAVLLAEDSDGSKWVIFKCEDRMHAIKAARRINEFGFDVEAVARKDNIYVRKSLV